MRYPPEHKRAVREALVGHAARMVRGDGIERTSVARVMAKAKMTVGGFYRHFGAQDELIGEALAAAMRESAAMLCEGAEGLEGRSFERALIERYLSEWHFDHRARGCPIAATLSELSRQTSAARTPLQTAAAELVAFVSARVRPVGDREARAWTLLSSLAGGLALARSFGPKRGREMLGRIRQTHLEVFDAIEPSCRSNE